MSDPDRNSPDVTRSRVCRGCLLGDTEESSELTIGPVCHQRPILRQFPAVVSSATRSRTVCSSLVWRSATRPRYEVTVVDPADPGDGRRSRALRGAPSLSTRIASSTRPRIVSYADVLLAE